MSWIDRLQNTEFEITTGDGKIYKPLWKNGSKEKDFNATKYDFINVEGSFVDRKKAQSNKYPLVFWFQGEDNIDQSDSFELSANDSRPWTIVHPFYGVIKGQPISLKRNDQNYNITEINVDFWESITDDYPLSSISALDTVRGRVKSLNQVSINSLLENSKPATSNIVTLKNSSTILASKFSPDSDSFTDYKNIVEKSVNSVDTLVTQPQSAFESLQEVINAPSEFNNTVIQKIKSYLEAFNVLIEDVENVFDKYYFESQASSIICGMCLASMNPGESDYVTRSDVEEVDNIITGVYEDYLAEIDSNQVQINDVSNYWLPNVLIQSNLFSLVNFTLKQLYVISFNAKQERVYELEYDSNLILLTHRFLGLDENDENIETFRKVNNIKNDELFKIRKGRTIKYFV